MHSIASQGDFQQHLQTLSEGLGEEESRRLRMPEYAWEAYGEAALGSGSASGPMRLAWH